MCVKFCNLNRPALVCYRTVITFIYIIDNIIEMLDI